nr:hypothetical protein [Streptococcus suis]
MTSHPIVPLAVPQSHRFERKNRNEILMKIRLGKAEVAFFQSINHEVNEETLAKKEVLETYLPWKEKIKRACK